MYDVRDELHHHLYTMYWSSQKGSSVTKVRQALSAPLSEALYLSPDAGTSIECSCVIIGYGE